ncbi:MAG TPA: GTPase HflX [Eubacteriaceae bacterium]|nr:GTPase HflX [Eubacteriaceae bacterium]
MIQGNIEGIKKSTIQILDELVGKVQQQVGMIDEQTARTIWEISESVNREIILISDRKNKILSVGVGDFKSAVIPEIENQRQKGLRCVHTHPSKNPKLSKEDQTALKEFEFEVMASLVLAEEVPIVHLGILSGDESGEKIIELGPYTLEESERVDLTQYAREYRKWQKKRSGEQKNSERALLLGIDFSSGRSGMDVDSSMQELLNLTKTAGVVPVESLVQKRKDLDPKYYVGKGKLMECKSLIQIHHIDVVLVNDELSANQLRTMESLLDRKIIDRTGLILDIFAARAQSMEGKLQVELAQLKYRSSRLIGLGHVLSRTGGGIGTRGPGEKKLETDRRRIQKQINVLENKLNEIEKNRLTQRKQRKKSSIPTVALVGYTNSGKSTLFNRITTGEVLAEDKLFATLDSTTREVSRTNPFLMSDTVGFIDKLPHDLVDAFKSTLEEVLEADLVLHVVDASHPKWLEHIEVAEGVLDSIEAGDKPVIYLFNKWDAVENPEEVDMGLIRGTKVKISARTGFGIQDLYAEIDKVIFGEILKKRVEINQKDQRFRNQLFNAGVVTDERYWEDKIILDLTLNKENFWLYEQNKEDFLWQDITP